MRGARTVAVGIAALAASLAITLAVEAAPRGMVNVPAGLYKPFLKEKALNDGGKAAALTRRVDAFRLDVEPVTNAEVLAFVAAHPQWRKSRIKALFADDRYLKRWPSDLELADAADRNEPVTDVSCRRSLLQGARLPSADD